RYTPCDLRKRDVPEVFSISWARTLATRSRASAEGVSSDTCTTMRAGQNCCTTPHPRGAVVAVWIGDEARPAQPPEGVTHLRRVTQAAAAAAPSHRRGVRPALCSHLGPLGTRQRTPRCRSLRNVASRPMDSIEKRTMKT